MYICMYLNDINIKECGNRNHNQCLKTLCKLFTIYRATKKWTVDVDIHTFCFVFFKLIFNHLFFTF